MLRAGRVAAGVRPDAPAEPSASTRNSRRLYTGQLKWQTASRIDRSDRAAEAPRGGAASSSTRAADAPARASASAPATARRPRPAPAARGRRTDRPRDRRVRRHAARLLAGARRRDAADHQAADEPRHDEDRDAVAHRRRGPADRGRARARGDDQARRRRRRRARDRTRTPRRRSRRGRRSSRSWATSTTARRRCSTRSARRRSSTTEAGGITQHIGAYQADHNGRRITFLDTPGHEAFTAMRARGAKVTDIAVLVVAADDGVMPQTKESISHARAADVPIVVAVNKIDLPDSNPDRVLSELATEGLQPEEWGGDVQVARVSAKQGENLDDLLERILLVADAELDLRANPSAEARARSSSRASTSAAARSRRCSIHRGTLKVGDAIVAGDAWGRVRALYDYRGERIQEARPGEPVEILGFDRPPPAGELGRVVENERRARELAHQRGERLRREAIAKQSSAAASRSSQALRADAGRRRPGPEPRHQGRRAGLRRGDRLRARQDPAPRGARQRHPHRRRRHHRERRQPRRRLEGDGRRLQRAAVGRGARRRRARRASRSASTASSTS